MRRFTVELTYYQARAVKSAVIHERRAALTGMERSMYRRIDAKLRDLYLMPRVVTLSLTEDQGDALLGALIVPRYGAAGKQAFQRVARATPSRSFRAQWPRRNGGAQ